MNIDSPHFRRQVHRIHRLGERVLGELLIEVGADGAVVDRYAALDPDVLAALGGDQFPPPVPLYAVRST